MALLYALALVPTFKEVVIEQTGEIRRIPDETKPQREQPTFVRPEMVYKTQKGEFVIKVALKSGTEIPVKLKGKPEQLTTWNEGE